MAFTFCGPQVPPKHWVWARQRDAVLHAYLAIETPTVRDADEAASKLGIKRRAFYYILERSRRQMTSKASTNRATSYGPNVSRNTAARRQRRDNSLVTFSVNEQSRFAVDHTPLEIAITSSFGKAPGYLTVIIDRMNGSILGHHLDSKEPGPHSVSNALAEWWIATYDELGEAVTCIKMHISTDPHWLPLLKIFRENGLNRIGRRMRRLPMGSLIFERMDKLGAIPMRPRLSEDKLRHRISDLPAVELVEARCIVDEAIRAWNSRHPEVSRPALPAQLGGALPHLADLER